MSSFTCEKTENCFSNSQTYLYIIGTAIDDDFLASISALGRLEVKRNLRRPFFFLHIDDGTQVRGMLRDDRLKASFPDSDLAAAKQRFESRLIEVLEGKP